MIKFGFEMVSEIEKLAMESRRLYEELTTKSRNEAIAKADAGSRIPESGMFFDDKNRQAFNDKLAALGSTANKAVDDYLAGIKLAASKTPSEEAMRAIKMFLMMDADSISTKDYAARCEELMNKFPEMLTYETIRTAAIKRGIHDFPVHSDIEKRNAVEDIRHNTNSFFNGHHVSRNEVAKPITIGEVSLFVSMLKRFAGVLDDNAA